MNIPRIRKMGSLEIMDIQRYKNSNSQKHILANTFCYCSLYHENTLRLSLPQLGQILLQKKNNQKPQGKGEKWSFKCGRSCRKAQLIICNQIYLFAAVASLILIQVLDMLDTKKSHNFGIFFPNFLWCSEYLDTIQQVRVHSSTCLR